MRTATRSTCAVGVAFALAAAFGAAHAQPLTWRTIVNNANVMPGAALTFNSFNQPSVNSNGVVVFRARSKGSAGAGESTNSVEFSAEPPTWSTIDAAAGTGPAGILTFPRYAVPGAPAGTRFDQFPGAPAVTNGTVIAFKGNYTDPADTLGKTGVHSRDVAANAGQSAIQVVANSNTVIPNPPGAPVVTFGSTAPPSAANGYMVFTGLDIEEAPTRGGIYRAPLQPLPALQTLAGIGDQVPGELAGTGFNAFGEGLSISQDARYVSFWGAWGTETFDRLLLCPTDGNAEVIAYCQENYPMGFTVASQSQRGNRRAIPDGDGQQRQVERPVVWRRWCGAIRAVAR